VPFGREYCDERFMGDKYLLMQCYSSKNVPRGEEFCLANFDPKKEREVFLECFETIPLYTADYCQVKYDRDPDQKVDCFKNKAGLVLDKGYCDNKFPLLLVEDGEKVLNKRYACYREIQLPGFEKKDVEYCEYVNLADTQAKYDCIDALN